MQRIKYPLLGLVLWLLTWPTQLLGQELLDRIVAIVDDEIILESEVTRTAWMFCMQYGIDPTRDQEKFKEFRKAAAQNMVMKELLVIQADKDTVEANEREVDGYLEEQMQANIRQAGGEEKLEEIFGMTMSRIRRSLRDDIEKELRAMAVQKQKTEKVTVNRREVKEFYETMKDSLGQIGEIVDISHILVEIKAGEKARMAALEKAQQIRKKLLDGEDFAELAKNYSDDPGSAARGGDLGFTSRGEFVREYAEAASNLEVNEISDIVESQFGFHIIQLLEKRGEKIHTRHILVGIQPSDEDMKAAAEKIKSIHKQLVDGADFAQMVAEYSDDASSREDQGHLGTHQVNDLKNLPNLGKEYVFALQGMQAGEISDPFKTNFGFHVVKLNAKKEARAYDFDKDYDTLAGYALEFKKQKALQEWLDQMKEQVYIEYKDKSLM